MANAKKLLSLMEDLTQYKVDGPINSPMPPVTLIPALTAGIYKISITMQGVQFVEHFPSSDKLLRFKDERQDLVMNEISKFWELKPNFDNLGFLHKRGIMLYGPPGTGKSCLLALTMNKMVEDGNIVFICTGVHQILEGLKAFREVEPDRKLLVVLEDIDELISYGEHALLELFDGENQIDNVLYLATTNYIDRIPARILRPSRFDRKVEIGYPPAEGRYAYLNSKLQSVESPEKIKELVNKTDGFSFAQLRELIVAVYCLEEDLEATIARLSTPGNVSKYDNFPDKKIEFAFNKIKESKNCVASKVLGSINDSSSRDCRFWKATDGKWYMFLAYREYGEYPDGAFYGPFSSEDAANKYLDNNFSNPGGYSRDDSGKKAPPVNAIKPK